MFGFQDRRLFERVQQSEDCEALSISSGDNVEKDKAPLPQALISWLLVLTFLVAAILGALSGKKLFLNTNSLCIEKTSQYSPVLEDLEVTYHATRFNGSFLKEKIYRQIASPEVDAAWKDLGVDYRNAIVPRALAKDSGISPDHVHIRDKYGGGFPANVEGLHHLHCLNLLRQSLYYNYEYYHGRGEGAFKNEEPILRLHVSHCLDILRQQLMCNIDVGVLGRVWWNKQDPTPFPDFNTNHKCRNFDDVRRWAFEHQGPDRVPEDYLEPPRDLSIVHENMP